MFQPLLFFVLKIIPLIVLRLRKPYFSCLILIIFYMYLLCMFSSLCVVLHLEYRGIVFLFCCFLGDHISFGNIVGGKGNYRNNTKNTQCDFSLLNFFVFSLPIAALHFCDYKGCTWSICRFIVLFPARPYADAIAFNSPDP